MLTFIPFSVETLKTALPYLNMNKTLCSDLSAGALFMWQEGTNLQFSFFNDTLILRQNIGEQPAFTWPIGADVFGAVDAIIEYVKANDFALRFYEVDDTTLEIIKSDNRLKPVMCEYEERWSDYIYSFADAIDFKGSKFKGQRNHINKFKRLYGEPNIRFLKKEDREDLRKMLSEYHREHGDADILEELEFGIAEKLLDVADDLSLYAACLTVKGKIAAFSIGEAIGDMLIIHIEKALRRYEGIYPTMYQGFLKLVSDKTGKTFSFINREDDSGDEGLRISKMQYHPIGKVNKYLAHINSPAYRIEKMPVLRFCDVVLTKLNEDDKAAYRELNTDIKNNRYWGYDYREDDDITGKIDDNTFYDLVTVDMHAGDSINFAVRNSENGVMIGEALLWNFTFGGSAEVGCRLLPEFQGKGYGTAAFKVLSDFAENTLKVRVKARCFTENAASRRMIENSGYKLIKTDEKFYYFAR